MTTDMYCYLQCKCTFTNIGVDTLWIITTDSNMYICFGVRWCNLYILVKQMAAPVNGSSYFVFFYEVIDFVCWALVKFVSVFHILA